MYRMHVAPMREKKTFCDGKHWRRRAEATRTKAASLDCDKSRDKLFRVAREYDKLACLADGRLSDENELEI